MQVSKDLTDYELILNENNDSKAQDNKYEFDLEPLSR